MKRVKISSFFAPENLFVAVYLFLYAAILLSSDPEWLMWAGPITLGAFPLTAAPPLPFGPAETFRTVGSGAFLGLAALAFLFLTNGNPHSRGAVLDKTTRA